MSDKAYCSAPLCNRKYLYLGSLPVIETSDFLPCSFHRGHLAMSGDISVVIPGILWVEAKDTANYPTVHWTNLTTNNFLAQNVNSTEAEKTCCRETDLSAACFHHWFSL